MFITTGVYCHWLCIVYVKCYVFKTLKSSTPLSSSSSLFNKSKVDCYTFLTHKGYLVAHYVLVSVPRYTFRTGFNQSAMS